MNRIDLHTHSNKSDGSLSPTELIAYAKAKGLSAIALTDHDSIAGIREARSAAANAGIDFVAGVELSVSYHGADIHLVGLFIDEEAELLQRALSELSEKRANRNRLMIRKMKAVGLDIDEEALVREGERTSLTRLHFALHLKERGCVREIEDAFRLYLNEGQACYVDKEMLSAKEGIRIILGSGGIPILAHPLRYGMSWEKVEEMVVFLKLSGLKGMECFYSLHSQEEERDMAALAGKYDLLLSGGSDFHGNHKHSIDLGVGRGNLAIPEHCLRTLCDVHQGRRVADAVMIDFAAEEDIAELAAIEAACFPPEEAAGPAALASRVRAFPECFFIARYQEQIIGFINGCASDQAHLSDEMYHDTAGHKPNGRYQMIFGLDVLPAFRKQGVARKLMNHMILASVQRGRSGLVLTCKERLVPYYESFGYENKGRSASVHGGVDWFEMVRDIIR